MSASSTNGLGHGEPLRIAVYTGVCFQRDAVSTSFLEKLKLFTGLRHAGYPVEVTGFTLASDCHHESIKVVSGITELICSPEFARADLHIFEFAMWYELITALFLIGDRPSLVIDHNTTPPGMVDDPEVKLACERSWLERYNFNLASHVATDGEFTRDELLLMGFEADHLSVLHLPAATVAPSPRSPEHTPDRAGEPIRLLFVGRFVRAKGILDLVAAAEALWDEGVDGFSLTLVGSIRFADSATVAAIDEALATHGESGRFSILVDASDDDLADQYGRADALVIPSYHEGFCVPVVEAMSSGCYVIGSDAGNIPNVMGGLGSTYPTGDVTSLSQRIAAFVAAVGDARDRGGEPVLPTDTGPLRLSAWNQAVSTHLAAYSRSRYEQDFLTIVADVLRDSDLGLPEWFADVVNIPLDTAAGVS